jgi:hypothetical protein
MDICNHHRERWKPTRLLKIDGDVQVALASELEGYPSYVTLSHCWGSLNFTTLTRNNLEQFRVRVPFEALTKSFQDAIYITRYLGLQYLWINSLCILQDDPNDWRKESSSMSSVYGGSTVNIAASSANDGSMGCFFDRYCSGRSQFKVEKDSDTLWDCYPDSLIWLQRSPLRSRGWVVQESFLSRRILHFTDREVFWECDEKVASETFPERFPLRREAAFVRGVKLVTQKRPMTQAIWANIVGEYSSCKLTLVRDRLVAISGLARLFEAELDDEYIYGLWRRNLESQLLWTAADPCQRITPCLAPSWSWASLDSHCRLDRPSYFGHIAHTCITVQQADIMGSSSADPPEECYTSPLGSSGRLRISCECLFYVTMSPWQHHHYRTQLGDCGINFYAHVIFDCRSAYDTAQTSQIKLFFVPVEVAMVPEAGTFFKETSDLAQVRGLMIEETGKARGQFRRVGYLGDWPLPLLQGKSMDSAYYIDDSKCVQIIVDGNGQRRFIIDLV